MSAEARDLYGEVWTAVEFSAPSSNHQAEAECLRLAADWIEKHDPDSIVLAGFHWRESTDEFVMKVIASAIRPCATEKAVAQALAIPDAEVRP